MGQYSTVYVTVTYSATYSKDACRWCGGEIPGAPGPGRPRRYCRRSHRQRPFEARRAARRLQLDDEEVLLSRRNWETLRQALGRLSALSAVIAADIASGEQPSVDYAVAIGTLSAAVAELQEAVQPTAAW